MKNDKKNILAYNFELGKIFNTIEGLPENYQNFTWLCTICRKRLFYNNALDCFLHKGNRNYFFEPETIEHKTMKVFWYLMFPKFNPISIKKLEYKIGDQIADLYFELTNGKKDVIECQNSQISKRKLIERTKKYTHKNIYVLWIFNGLGPCISDKKNPRNENNIGVQIISFGFLFLISSLIFRYILGRIESSPNNYFFYDFIGKIFYIKPRQEKNWILYNLRNKTIIRKK